MALNLSAQGEKLGSKIILKIQEIIGTNAKEIVQKSIRIWMKKKLIIIRRKNKILHSK